MRKIIISIGFLILLALVIFLSRQMVSKANMAEAEAAKAIKVEIPVRSVSTFVAKNESHRLETKVSGILVARDRYSVYAEVAGRMLPTTPAFKKGNYFKVGVPVLVLDHQVEALNLVAKKNQLYNAIASMMPDVKLGFAAAEARWDKYLSDFDETKSLEPLPEFDTEKEKLFVSARGIKQQYIQIKAEEARLKKYKVTTPISGILTEAMVQPSSFVQPGQRLGEIAGNYRFEMEMSLAPEDVKNAKPGRKVDILNSNTGKIISGRISRINPIIESQTQTMTAIVEVSGKDLYHGMFVEGTLQGDQLEATVLIDRGLLLSGDQLFVVEDEQLVKIPVLVKAVQGNQAYLSGIADGTVVLEESSSSFSVGTKVTTKLKSR